MRGFRIVGIGAAKAAPYCLLLLAATASAQARRPIGIDDLLAFHRISEPQISPDGASVVYTVATPDRAGNTSVRNIWIVPTAGGAARQLTASGKDSGARWSPDGRRLAFVSSRDGDAAALHDAARRAASPPGSPRLSGGADNIVWSPDGQTIAFTSEVYPDCRTTRATPKRDEGARRRIPSRPHLRRAALPPLDSVERGQAPSPVRRAVDRRHGAGSDCPAPTTTCRRRSAKARTRLRSRPTTGRSASRPSSIGWRRRARTAICSRLTADGARRHAEEDDDRPWVRRRAGLFARRQDDRCTGRRREPGTSPTSGGSCCSTARRDRHTSLTDRFDRSVEAIAVVDRRQVDLLQRRGPGRTMPMFSDRRDRRNAHARSPTGMFDGEFDQSRRQDARRRAQQRRRRPPSLFR